MKVPLVISGFLFAGVLAGSALAAPSPEQMQALVKSRPELDEIRWKDPARGAPLKVRIIQADDRVLVVEKTLPAGVTLREVPLVELGSVEIFFTAREKAMHAVPAVASIPPLRVYWETRQGTLRLPGSNASLTGLALAKSLRMTGDAASFEEAGKILDRIRSQETVRSRLDAVRAEQANLDFVRSLKKGKPGDSDELAWKITEETDNPDGMLLATAYLADRHFADLRETEENHPRWMEDNEVKPVREKLHNLALDFALYPSLFLAMKEDESAAGLAKAAEIHRFTGDRLLAKNTLEDLAALYPESAAARETAALLDRLRKEEAAGKTGAAPDASAPGKPEEKQPSPDPVPAKRYNIFGE